MRAGCSTSAAIYYAQPDGSSIREVVFPSDSPNGIGLSPDGTRLYAAETHTGRLYAWNVTEPGEVERNTAGATGTVLCGLPGMQLFDSLGVDSDGNIVVATLVTGGLTVISPDGAVLDQVILGDPMVTNVCFGGDDLTHGLRDPVRDRPPGEVSLAPPRPEAQLLTTHQSDWLVWAPWERETHQSDWWVFDAGDTGVRRLRIVTPSSTEYGGSSWDRCRA